MMKSSRILLTGLALALLAGCATLQPSFKEPGVSVVSVTPKASSSISPQFDIVLHVTNPNRSALDIVGLTYTIHLAGNKIIDGVASDLPSIAAYGEADVRLNATANLLNSFKLLTSLVENPGAPVNFEFNAEIDVGTFYPMIKVKKVGAVAFK